MTEIFSVDLANVLLFTMPGFFFLRAMGYKTESDLTYFMYSMFWGILFMVFVYKLILPLERIVPLIDNPYAGAIIFSLLAWAVGTGLRMIKPRFPIEF